MRIQRERRRPALALRVEGWDLDLGLRVEGLEFFGGGTGFRVKDSEFTV